MGLKVRVSGGRAQAAAPLLFVGTASPGQIQQVISPHLKGMAAVMVHLNCQLDLLMPQELVKHTPGGVCEDASRDVLIKRALIY
jgi:hypothetical protein